MGLINPEGKNIAEQVIELKEQKQTYTFENIAAKPVASLFRDFSAPVKVEHKRSEKICYILSNMIIMPLIVGILCNK